MTASPQDEHASHRTRGRAFPAEGSRRKTDGKQVHGTVGQTISCTPFSYLQSICELIVTYVFSKSNKIRAETKKYFSQIGYSKMT